MKLSKKDKDAKGDHQATHARLKRDMKEGPLVDRISGMLHDVYYNQEVVVRMSSLINKHELPTVTGPALIGAGVMTCTGSGPRTVWKWSSKDEPSHDMAEAVFQQIIKRRDYHTQKSKNKAIQATKNKAIEDNINKRNLSKIDRQLLANDHMLMDLSERLSRIYGLIKYLHLKLANKGWVLGREVDLILTPPQFKLSTSILQHIYPNVLEKRGTLNNFEVRAASNFAPSIADAADIIRKERDYLVQVSVNDPEGVKKILSDYVQGGMPYSEFTVTDSQLDSVVASMVGPAVKSLDEAVGVVNAIDMDDLHDVDVSVDAAPLKTWNQLYQENMQTNQIVSPEVAEEVDKAVVGNDERRLILELAKKFTRLKEYQIATDLLNDLGV